MNYWPDGMTVDPIGAWPGTLTLRRKRSDFASPLSSTMEVLRRELRQLAAKNARLQIAIDAGAFRLDGKPRATAKPEHPGVILTLDSKHGPLSYPCDTFTTWQDNLRAIALALEALRKVDRYGVTKSGEQYRGFRAIEATAALAGFANTDEALAFLGTFSQLGLAEMKAIPNAPARALRRAQRAAHPDTGGDVTTFRRVTLAGQYLKQNGAI